MYWKFLRALTVLGSSARSFNTVLEHAQKILRKTFGMELVELRSRAEIQVDGNANGNKDDDLEEARNATGVKKKGIVVFLSFHAMLFTFVQQLLPQAQKPTSCDLSCTLS
jgi:hypothetical protein